MRLYSHKDVDKKALKGARIAILGFSFGGEVAHDTAFERLRAILVATGAQLLALAETRVGEKYVNVQVPKLWQQWHSK